MKNFLPLLLTISRSKLITILGLITVAISAIDPALFEGHPKIRLAVLTTGAIATALGRALLHPSVEMFAARYRSVALLLVPLFALTLVTTGCPKVITKQAVKTPVVLPS